MEFFVKKKDIKIIDARKPFEYDVGTFEGAVNPKVNISEIFQSI